MFSKFIHSIHIYAGQGQKSIHEDRGMKDEGKQR